MDKRKIFFISLLVWWSIAFILGFIQAYFMTRAIISLLIMPIFIFLFCLGMIQLYRLKNKIVFYIIGILHFIPLIMQFFSKQPALDNIVMALVGLGIIYFSARKK